MAAVLYKWLLVALSAFMHPFYVSVTEMNHNPAEKSIEISSKIFIDDFETVLSKQFKATVDLSNPKDKKLADQWVATYVQQHLKLKIDGKAVTVQFVGYEKENEAAWCYFEVAGVAAFKKLEVQNTLLYDGFNNQINIMHVTNKGQRKSTRLNYPAEQVSFEF